MDKKNIQSILRDALEEEIPSEEIKLWPAVKADLVAGQQQGEKMNLAKLSLLSKATIAALVIIALLTAVFLTPPGRVFAQTFFQFFTRTESKERPLLSEQVPSPEEAGSDFRLSLNYSD